MIILPPTAYHKSHCQYWPLDIHFEFAHFPRTFCPDHSLCTPSAHPLRWIQLLGFGLRGLRIGLQSERGPESPEPESQLVWERFQVSNQVNSRHFNALTALFFLSTACSSPLSTFILEICIVPGIERKEFESDLLPLFSLHSIVQRFLGAYRLTPRPFTFTLSISLPLFLSLPIPCRTWTHCESSFRVIFFDHIPHSAYLISWSTWTGSLRSTILRTICSPNPSTHPT